MALAAQVFTGLNSCFGWRAEKLKRAGAELQNRRSSGVSVNLMLCSRKIIHLKLITLLVLDSHSYLNGDGGKRTDKFACNRKRSIVIDAMQLA